MITTRDLVIMRLLNRFGFMGAADVAAVFGLIAGDGGAAAWEQTQEKNKNIETKVVYRRLKKLVDTDLLRRKRILFDEPGMFYLTPKGVTLCDSNLSAIGDISPGTFLHRIYCLRVAAELLTKYGGWWETERELYKKNFKSLNTSRIKIPDGILHVPNGGTAAIEVELTKKTNSRIRQLLRQYDSDIKAGKYVMVQYYVANKGIKAQINQVVTELGAGQTIKVFDVPEGGQRKNDEKC